MKDVKEIARLAKEASVALGSLDSAKKNLILTNIAKALREETDTILAANQEDINISISKGVPQSIIDRLSLNSTRIEDIAIGVEQVVVLEDPIGEVLSEWNNKDGLLIKKIRVPFGVVAMIYENRPNVTVDAAVLCLKTGNAAILRGSSSALNSNIAIIKVIQNVLADAGINPDAVQLITDPGHSATEELLHLRGLVDLVIPRGGASFIKSVVENSTVPVIETGAGICHVYAHSDANYQMTENIVLNAKTQRPSVCNALETLLVHKDWAKKYLSDLYNALSNRGVECRGCEQAICIVPEMKQATEKDWETEYLDYILAIKIVDNEEQAISHITKYGTKHSESIITESKEVANLFLRNIDAAAVYHNASTRFTDGFEFGLGAEIGISTQKLHARGPMGLKEMTSYKYCIFGNGQIRK